MVQNLTKHSQDRLDKFATDMEDLEQGQRTIQDLCLIQIAESLMILADKIGRRLP